MDCCLDVEEIITNLELDKIKNRQWNIIATSAKNRMGLFDGFLWLKDIINSKYSSKWFNINYMNNYDFKAIY